jgi:hypothetical protein
MRRETTRVSFLMCPFCVRGVLLKLTTNAVHPQARLKLVLIGRPVCLCGDWWFWGRRGLYSMSSKTRTPATTTTYRSNPTTVTA